MVHITAGRDQFLKTKMCPHFLANSCSKGAECFYAHSANELRDIPDLRKTRLCDQFQKYGYCATDSACFFAHGEKELRFTSRYLKTDLCKYWIAGHCESGDNCRHAHGVDELRPRKFQEQEINRLNEGEDIVKLLVERKQKFGEMHERVTGSETPNILRHNSSTKSAHKGNGNKYDSSAVWGNNHGNNGKGYKQKHGMVGDEKDRFHSERGESKQGKKEYLGSSNRADQLHRRQGKGGMVNRGFDASVPYSSIQTDYSRSSYNSLEKASGFQHKLNHGYTYFPNKVNEKANANIIPQSAQPPGFIPRFGCNGTPKIDLPQWGYHMDGQIAPGYYLPYPSVPRPRAFLHANYESYPQHASQITCGGFQPVPLGMPFEKMGEIARENLDCIEGRSLYSGIGCVDDSSDSFPPDTSKRHGKVNTPLKPVVRTNTISESSEVPGYLCNVVKIPSGRKQKGDLLMEKELEDAIPYVYSPSSFTISNSPIIYKKRSDLHSKPAFFIENRAAAVGKLEFEKLEKENYRGQDRTMECATSCPPQELSKASLDAYTKWIDDPYVCNYVGVAARRFNNVTIGKNKPEMLQREPENRGLALERAENLEGGSQQLYQNQDDAGDFGSLHCDTNGRDDEQWSCSEDLNIELTPQGDFEGCGEYSALALNCYTPPSKAAFGGPMHSSKKGKDFLFGNDVNFIDTETKVTCISQGVVREDSTTFVPVELTEEEDEVTSKGQQCLSSPRLAAANSFNQEISLVKVGERQVSKPKILSSDGPNVPFYIAGLPSESLNGVPSRMCNFGCSAVHHPYKDIINPENIDLKKFQTIFRPSKDSSGSLGNKISCSIFKL